jgi:hypothetical protein
VLLLVAAALVLRPARALEARVFGLAFDARGPPLGFPPESEIRVVLSPLLVAAICFGVAVVSGFL